MHAFSEWTAAVLRVSESGEYGSEYEFCATVTRLGDKAYLQGVMTMGKHPHRVVVAIRKWALREGIKQVIWCRSDGRQEIYNITNR